jgi:hypothetical protein
MNSPSIYIKQKPDGPIQGPFQVAQVKMLVQQQKLKSSAVFSLDQKTWYAAAQQLPKLFDKYLKVKVPSPSSGAGGNKAKVNSSEIQGEGGLSSSGKKKSPRGVGASSVQREKNKAGSDRAGVKKGDKKKNSKSRGNRGEGKLTGSKRATKPRAAEKKSGGVLGTVLFLIVLLGAGGGLYFHQKVSGEMMSQADRALEAFCRSLQMEAAYELSVSPTLDKIILKNVSFKNQQKSIDLKAQMVECSIPVFMTMGWFLTDEIKIEQPLGLWVKAMGFEGVFVESGYLYKAGEIELDFHGAFVKKESVIEGEVLQAQVKLRGDEGLMGRLASAEKELSSVLPRESDAYVIDFKGPFVDVEIMKSSEAWKTVADLGFRGE